MIYYRGFSLLGLQNRYAGAALIIHVIFSAFALISAIFGLMVMKGTGKYEAFQLLNILALTAWFIVFPLAVIAVVLSLFSLGTIILLILALFCLIGVVNNFSNDAYNAALTISYPCGTSWMVFLLIREKRRALKT